MEAVLTMTHVGSNHAHDNSKPNLSLAGQAEHNAFIDSEQSVQASYVSQHHLQDGSDRNGCGGQSWDWNCAAEEAFWIEEAEIGSAESRNRLEKQEVVAVDDGDAGLEAELGCHGGLISAYWSVGRYIKVVDGRGFGATCLSDVEIEVVLKRKSISITWYMACYP
jgi:hypothetical protein